MYVSIHGILIFVITETFSHIMTKNNVYTNYVLHHKTTFRKSSNGGFAGHFIMKEKFQSCLRSLCSLTVPGAEIILKKARQTQDPQFPGAPEE